MRDKALLSHLLNETNKIIFHQSTKITPSVGDKDSRNAIRDDFYFCLRIIVQSAKHKWKQSWADESDILARILSAEKDEEFTSAKAYQEFNKTTPIYTEQSAQLMPKFIHRMISFENPSLTQEMVNRWALIVTLATKEVVKSPLLEQDLNAYFTKLVDVLSKHAPFKVEIPDTEALYSEAKERFKNHPDSHHLAKIIAIDSRKGQEKTAIDAVDKLFARIASGPK